ncbi:MAG TPA: NUDIX domain-containing protein [Solirubrobacteraceae bacterium]|nr:NUDIX domain-containing protein [Solirubrobacteraceae bacterium]
MRVKARGVVPAGDRLVVARESRRGRELLTLPGGRPARSERLQDAVVRGVREETGADVRVGEVFPPILERAFADLEAGWPAADPFLDNVHVARTSESP